MDTWKYGWRETRACSNYALSQIHLMMCMFKSHPTRDQDSLLHFKDQEDRGLVSMCVRLEFNLVAKLSLPTSQGLSKGRT